MNADAILATLRAGGRCAIRVARSGLPRATVRQPADAGAEADTERVSTIEARLAIKAPGVVATSETDTGLAVVTVYEWFEPVAEGRPS